MIDANLPRVTLSWAQSLDGRLATRTGDSQWIGGPESLRFAHELRRDHEVILVGVGTVLKDNPKLTCRIPGGRNPQRVILDSRLRTPLESEVLQNLHQAPTLIYANERASPERAQQLRGRGVKVIVLPGLGATLDLVAVLSSLSEGRFRSVFVEGGAAVLTAFLAGGLADRAIVVTSPFLIGEGISAVGDLGSNVLSEVPRPLRWRRWDLGNDLATELVFR